MVNSDFLLKDTISRQEFRYPHGQDKRTILLNNVLKKIILGGLKTPDSFVCEFKCEIPNKKYNFNISVPNQYNNAEILWEITYSFVEQALTWLDLSEFDNFEVKVDDGGFVTKSTYYELANWGMKRIPSPLISPVFYSEDKKIKIRDFISEKLERERVEWEKKYKPDMTMTIERPISRIKKFFKF